MLNLHLLECTVKGYDHISDLLLAKYWVITGCKYNNCKSLKEFSIHTPTQIKLIGNFLHGCYSLEKLYIYSYREPEGEKLIFEDKVINNCTLYIPRNRMAYQYNYKPWTYFKEIIEME